MVTCECHGGGPRWARCSISARCNSWRRMRRASHDALTKAVVQRYCPIQTKEANILVTSLLTNPKDRNQHFLRAGASTIMAILYDYPTLPSAHERAIEEIGNSVQQSARAASLGSALVEFLPWMLHIPPRYESPFENYSDIVHLCCLSRFAKWKREALEQSAERSEIYFRLFNGVRTGLVRPAVRTCVEPEQQTWIDEWRRPSELQRIVDRIPRSLSPI